MSLVRFIPSFENSLSTQINDPGVYLATVKEIDVFASILSGKSNGIIEIATNLV